MLFDVNLDEIAQLQMKHGLMKNPLVLLVSFFSVHPFFSLHTPSHLFFQSYSAVHSSSGPSPKVEIY